LRIEETVARIIDRIMQVHALAAKHSLVYRMAFISVNYDFTMTISG